MGIDSFPNRLGKDLMSELEMSCFRKVNQYSMSPKLL